MKTFPTSANSSYIPSFFVASIFSLVLILMISDLKANPATSMLPSGLVFRVRAEKSDSLMNQQIRNEYAPVYDGTANTELGAFNDFIRAQKAKNLIRDKGFKNVELIAYFNHTEISIDDAITLLNNRNSFEEASTQQISIHEMDSLLAMVANENLYFAITIELNDAKTVNNFFELSKKMEVRVDPNGKQVMVFGKFNTPEDAEVYLELLSQQGIASTSLSAWNKNGGQVPMDRALEIHASRNQELADQ